MLLTSGGIVLALLFAVMSLVGLLGSATYERETAAWLQQAIAQDWFDLVVACPALIATALWARRGSRRALSVYAGTLLFAAYTAAIYAFAVHLNALFLVYCAALGVSIYTLLGTLGRLWQTTPHFDLAGSMPHRGAAGFLVGVGVVFALLWLAQLVPSALHGTVPTELAATGLLTNPVHVIDLSFILPLHVIAGVALWRKRSTLALLGGVMLVFGAMMSSSIALLAVLASSAPVAGAIGGLAVASAVLAVRVLR